MDGARRNVFLLACCQGLLLTNAVTLVAVSSLVGYAIAANKALATLPATIYVIGAALSTFPASMWMKRVGRRNGFLTGGCIGALGAVAATIAVARADFTLFCISMLALGAYNAFGQYYRFAAADAASGEFKPKAISYVLAGGLAGGIIGPEVSRHTRDLGQPEYFATFASLVIFCIFAMAIVSRVRIPPSADSASGLAPRPLREIARQPEFLVAVGVAALGYGVMNLLMTATPLAMTFCGHPYDATAVVLASHVIGMFAPSFFTGALIKRFGVLSVMLAGVVLLAFCVGVAVAGQSIAHFWWALVLLGLGWNFTYIGGSTLLTEVYRPSEKAKVQGTNEIAIFGVQALSSFSAGVLVNSSGWQTLNYVALPLIAFAAASALWLAAARRRNPAAPTAP
ncbi:MAG TPA: MFS transporter [Usitatibacter sp.]|nr:MFS transporter [Usitatibacter sp.]